MSSPAVPWPRSPTRRRDRADDLQLANQDQIDRGLKAGITREEAAELTAARKRIRALETELAVVRRANELLKEQTDPKGGGRSSTPS